MQGLCLIWPRVIRTVKTSNPTPGFCGASNKHSTSTVLPFGLEPSWDTSTAGETETALVCLHPSRDSCPLPGAQGTVLGL